MPASMPNTDSEEIRRACEDALDELTASLTQVMKAVNKMHRALKRLDLLTPEPAPQCALGDEIRN